MVNRQMPTPKNEARTKPSAASSLCLVVLRIPCTVPAPSNPAKVAPIKMASGSFVMFQRNPKATPGSTACDNASPINASLRTTRKAPMSPQQTPSSMEPASALRSDGSWNVKNLTARSVIVESESSLIRAACAASGTKQNNASKTNGKSRLMVVLRVSAPHRKGW